MTYHGKQFAILSAILLTLGAGAAFAQSVGGNGGGGAGGLGGFGGGDPGGGMYEAFSLTSAPPPPRRNGNGSSRQPARTPQICGGIESAAYAINERCPR